MTELTRIPGNGKNMSQCLISAGYRDIESLKGQDPDDVYAKGEDKAMELSRGNEKNGQLGD